jgi:hypothetical protein
LLQDIQINVIAAMKNCICLKYFICLDLLLVRYAKVICADLTAGDRIDYIRIISVKENTTRINSGLAGRGHSIVTIEMKAPVIADYVFAIS